MRAASSGVRPSSSASGSSAQPSGTSTRYFITPGYVTGLREVPARSRAGTVPRSCVAPRSEPRSTVTGLVLSTLLLLAGVPTPASAAPELRLTKVAKIEGVTALIAARPGTRTLYLIQQNGVVRTLRDGSVASTPAIDLRDQVNQDGASAACSASRSHPTASGCTSTTPTRDGNTRSTSTRCSGRNADPASRRTLLLHVEQPQPNHNGGQLAFGPDG